MSEISQTLTKLLAQTVNKLLNLTIKESEIELEHPANLDHGDLSSNLALKLIKQQNKFSNPRELAQQLVDELIKNKPKLIEKIEVAGPGFINFYFSSQFYLSNLDFVIERGIKFGRFDKNKPRKIYIEHTQPNTNKPNHIGHLRNSVLGMALVNIMKAAGDNVVSTNINNDRGIANVKGMWAYLALGRAMSSDLLKKYQKITIDDDFNWQLALQAWETNPKQWKTPTDFKIKPDHWVGIFYVLGNSSYEANEKSKKEMQKMVVAWESGDKAVRKLWKTMNNWFYQGSKQSLARLGVKLDIEEYESDLYQKGKEIILDAIKTKNHHFRVLDDGAIQAILEPFKIPNKILIRRDGTAIYMTFDIELTRKRTQEYKMDVGIWVVGSDQELHFKQLFKICQLLKMGQIGNWHHLSYGMVELPSGKMSSRTGSVVYLDDVLDQAVGKANKIITTQQLKRKEDLNVKKISEIVGVGAVQYAMLNFNPQSKITFDIDRALNFEGNSGPYLQYSCVRCASVLKKGLAKKTIKVDSFNLEEKLILTLLYQYPEVIQKTAALLSPNILCEYLYQLAQAYNHFYNQHSILNSQNSDFRLKLTQAVSIVLNNGLSLLGIQVPEKM